MIYPVITLYQPWATWIMRGWKTIETRTHDRFSSLNKKKVLIHAGKRTDENAINNPYLTKEQLLHNPDEIVNGFILGSVLINGVGWINSTHSSQALIECVTQRYGLFLDEVKVFDNPIPVKGDVGIWYFDMDKKEKVKKPKSEPQLF